VGAGTVEFLVDAGRRFYFMEMNTRLQVEHGVTELVWGVDLVQEQLRIALEGLMGFDPAALNPSGNAIECRIIAEDPGRGFTPSPGRLSVFAPPMGPGIRNDTGVAAGDEVSRHYDPMFAKLLVRGETREEALDRCRTALADYAVLGVATNIPFLQHLLDARAMREGRLSTQVLEDELLPAFQASPPVIPPEALIAAAAIDLHSATPLPGDPWTALGRRRAGGRRLFACTEGSVTLRALDGGWQAVAGENEREVRWEPEGDRNAATVFVDGVTHRVWWHMTAAGISLSLGGRPYSFTHLRPAGFGSGARAAALHGERGLAAPMPAVVVRVLVQPGDAVQARQTLVVLEAMKMEHLIQSPAAGVVRRVHCTEGNTVAEGAVLVEVGEP
jgi:acetyl/propionyl-CoA carboxylase alpha subunit